jgi:hypothetical protein
MMSNYSDEFRALILKTNLLTTLQRLGLLNRNESISLDDGTWFMKQ